ncbi:larval cuticle protein LCP-17-like [Episyrphus balteatus]|uniref:larval cuticle protein LCP-17-like n=1 Tax=Episyrphus balteatus TaxID=286459 RepID=UPI0024858756|nr:larval cuticle protein LCP-17-like [Episyrphus balteatus]
MTSIKLFVLVVFVLGCANAQFGLPDLKSVVQPFAKQLLDVMVPKILLLEYKNVPTEEGYRFNYKTSDGSYREEVGMLMNPGTEQEELVVMGAYSYTDGDIETTTMYTADKNGYRPRVSLKNRGVSPKLLQSLSG